MIFIRVDMIHNQSTEKRTLGNKANQCAENSNLILFIKTKHSIYFSFSVLLLECFNWWKLLLSCSSCELLLATIFSVLFLIGFLRYPSRFRDLGCSRCQHYINSFQQQPDHFLSSCQSSTFSCQQLKEMDLQGRGRD